MRTIDPRESDAPELRILAGLRREHAQPNPNTLDRMRHTVLNSTIYRDAAPNHRAARRRPRRTAIAIAGGALALAAALGASTLLPSHAAKSPGLAQSGSTDSVAGLMTLAAQTATTTPPLNIRAGQYLYVRSGGHSIGSYQVGTGAKTGSGDRFVKVQEDSRGELWVDPEGMLPVRIHNTQGLNRKPLTPADAALAKQQGFNLDAPPVTNTQPDPNNPASCCLTQEYDKGKAAVAAHGGNLRRPTASYLAALPTEPGALLAALRKETGDRNKHTLDEQAYSAVLDLIKAADPILPSAQRAALYRAVTLIPGVSRTAGQVEINGQRGIAVGRTDTAGYREEFVLDVTGRQLVGFRAVQVTAANGVPAGTVMSWSTSEYRVVDQPGQTS